MIRVLMGLCVVVALVCVSAPAQADNGINLEAMGLSSLNVESTTARDVRGMGAIAFGYSTATKVGWTGGAHAKNVGIAWDFTGSKSVAAQGNLSFAGYKWGTYFAGGGSIAYSD